MLKICLVSHAGIAIEFRAIGLIQGTTGVSLGIPPGGGTWGRPEKPWGGTWETLEVLGRLLEVPGSPQRICGRLLEVLGRSLGDPRGPRGVTGDLWANSWGSLGVLGALGRLCCVNLQMTYLNIFELEHDCSLEDSFYYSEKLRRLLEC